MNNDRWIKVSDSLPKEDEYVLFLAKFDKGVRVVLFGRYDDFYKDWVSDDESRYGKDAGEEVTHWMSLPEPPKEE